MSTASMKRALPLLLLANMASGFAVACSRVDGSKAQQSCSTILGMASAVISFATRVPNPYDKTTHTPIKLGSMDAKVDAGTGSTKDKWQNVTIERVSNGQTKLSTTSDQLGACSGSLSSKPGAVTKNEFGKPTSFTVNDITCVSNGKRTHYSSAVVKNKELPEVTLIK